MYNSEQIFLYEPAENQNIMKSIDNLYDTYLKELKESNKVMNEKGFEGFLNVISKRFNERIIQSRDSSNIEIGDTFTFITDSWQAREAEIEGGEFIIADKFIDGCKRVSYLIRSVDMTKSLWIEEELLRAIKTGSVDQFVYVGEYVSRTPSMTAGF